jgi:hypothetical protein
MQEKDIQAIVDAVLAELQASERATVDTALATSAADGDDLQIDLEDPTLPRPARRPALKSRSIRMACAP